MVPVSNGAQPANDAKKEGGMPVLRIVKVNLLTGYVKALL